MICAVMQPYLFPYIGYYQLANLADYFVIYDDVNYIKQGFINRNNLLVNGEAARFTVPVDGGSSNNKINEVFFKDSKKTLKTIEQNYSKKENFSRIYSLVENVLEQHERNVVHINRMSIKEVFTYLGLEKTILLSSDLNVSKELSRADRLIEITKKLSCNHYVNAIGGKGLYDKQYFNENGIELSFIESDISYYEQGEESFVPGLSIIDILMNCGKEEIEKMLLNFKLV
ncbi:MULTISPECIES: WbqC family protein [unclassified Halomonas]|uniref:WbqC family protein n=1 Tax=unclassified Halomonas TaxID=2609666 RepID=UPI0004813A93|nr:MULTISPECIES: WbqC family protein [unclassified Halomonas]